MLLRPECGAVHPIDKTYKSRGNGSPYGRKMETFVGCTKILSVCKQTYLEGTHILQSQEHIIELPRDGQRLFRSPFENGRPGLFYSFKAGQEWRCTVPPRYCELQLVRVRRLATYIQDRRGQASFESAIKQLVAALAKNTDPRLVRIMIQGYVDHSRYDSNGRILRDPPLG